MQQGSDWSQLAARNTAICLAPEISYRHRRHPVSKARETSVIEESRQSRYSIEAKRYRDVPHHEYEVAKPPLD